MEKKDKRKSLSVKVNDEYYEKVREFAFAHRMSISDLMRAALNELMEKEGENGNIGFN